LCDNPIFLIERLYMDMSYKGQKTFLTLNYKTNRRLDCTSLKIDAEKALMPKSSYLKYEN